MKVRRKSPREDTPWEITLFRNTIFPDLPEGSQWLRTGGIPQNGDDKSLAAMNERLRVLVADDSAVNRKMASAMLTALGYDVDVVDNGRQAVEAVSRSCYEAVLMDCQMPEMDGYQAAQEIRRMEAPGRRLRIIAMTATISREDRDKALSSGMDDYLPKPLSLDSLEVALREPNVPNAHESPEKPMIDRRDDPKGDVIDPGRLAELEKVASEDGTDGFTVLARIFLEESAGRHVTVQDAIAQGDLGEIERLMHALKGTARNLGANALGDICERIEEQATEGPTGPSPELFAAFESEFTRVKGFLRQRIGDD